MHKVTHPEAKLKLYKELRKNHIYVGTDGSCRNKKGGRGENGGWGVVILFKDDDNLVHENRFSHGSYFNTTSARMEIRAILEALKTIDPLYPTTIYSDNQYAVKTIKAGWLYRWRKEKWKNALSKDGLRANWDLWAEIAAILDSFPKKEIINIEWIKGHHSKRSGFFILNHIADHLAGEAGKSKMVQIDDKVV